MDSTSATCSQNSCGRDIDDSRIPQSERQNRRLSSRANEAVIRQSSNTGCNIKMSSCSSESSSHVPILLTTFPGLTLHARALQRLMDLHSGSIQDEHENEETLQALDCLRSALYACVSRSEPCSSIVCLLCQAATHYIRSSSRRRAVNHDTPPAATTNAEDHGDNMADEFSPSRHPSSSASKEEDVLVSDRLILAVTQCTLYFCETEPNISLREHMYNCLHKGVVLNGYRFCGVRAFGRDDYESCLTHLEQAVAIAWSAKESGSSTCSNNVGENVVDTDALDTTVGLVLTMCRAHQGLHQFSKALELALSSQNRLPPDFQSPSQSKLVSFALAVAIRIPMVDQGQIDAIYSLVENAALFFIRHDQTDLIDYAVTLIAKSLFHHRIGQMGRAARWSSLGATMLENNADACDYRLQTAGHLVAGDHLQHTNMVRATRHYGKARTSMGLHIDDRDAMRDSTLLQACLERRLNALEKDDDSNDDTSVTYDSDSESLGEGIIDCIPTDVEAQELCLMGYILY